MEELKEEYSKIELEDNGEQTDLQDKTPYVIQPEFGVKNAEEIGPDGLYKVLIERVKKYHPSDDISMIEKAFKMAKEAHGSQKRKSGEPFIIHPLCVAIILADLQLDKETIVAGLLHDVVEDTGITYPEVEHEFGEEIADIVEGVTKLGKLNYSTDKLEEQAENLRKMFLAMAKDIRVILVKLADRLHNMRTLGYMDPEKQKEKARETLDIYAPLAQRLGISRLNFEIEDLALKYIQPDVYKELSRSINEKKEERQKFVDEIVAEVKAHIDAAGIKAIVNGRVKHFFSIYRKMINQDKDLDQIYDMFAVRIIVETVQDCYAALGVIHEMYTPVPGRFKDYIAMPKQNMYQSLHTTLMGPQGRPFEIQIRTLKMHKIAEYGIAAHWKYKEDPDGKKGSNDREEEKINWLRQILEWQRDMSDNEEFMSLLKSDLDLFTDKVYCFSPAGEVKTLPAGSCPIDFAYSVHSAVGNSMVGARINGKLVPIETKLRNGDRVEIVTSQNSRGPSRDWLKTVKSTTAKNRINQWFRNQLKEDNIIKGRDMLASYAKTRGMDINEYLKPEYMQGVLSKYGFRDWDAVMAAIGHGGLREGQVVNKLTEAYNKDRLARMTDEEMLSMYGETVRHDQENTAKGGILIKGMYGVAVHTAKCCSPIPGDEIIGFVTRGRGVTVHRTDCENVLNLPQSERVRLISAEWAVGSEEKLSYQVEINIFANNRAGLIVDVSRMFSEQKMELKTLNVRVNRQGIVTIDVCFNVKDKEELSSLVEKLRQVEGVIDIERTRG